MEINVAEVNGYRTSDQTVFEDKAAAIKHEWELQRKIKLINWVHCRDFSVSETERIVDVLLEEGREIVECLIGPDECVV